MAPACCNVTTATGFIAVYGIVNSFLAGCQVILELLWRDSSAIALNIGQPEFRFLEPDSDMLRATRNLLFLIIYGPSSGLLLYAASEKNRSMVIPWVLCQMTCITLQIATSLNSDLEKSIDKIIIVIAVGCGLSSLLLVLVAQWRWHQESYVIRAIPV